MVEFKAIKILISNIIFDYEALTIRKVTRTCFNKFCFILLVFWINTITISRTQAQEVDINNLENINVDKLSDEQIKEFSQEIKKRGLTESQLEVIARSRGLSSLQISKLRQRLFDVTDTSDGSTQNIARQRNEVIDQNSGSEESLFESLIDIKESDNDEESIFGMDFFANPNLTFQPSLNIATPTNYILGSGDQLVIDVWGASEQSYQLTISPEGTIIIPGIGPIFLSGESIENATKKIKSKLRRIYSGLGSNTYAQISLAQIRTILVNVIGEVKKPGTYTVSSFSNILNLLYFAGGPSYTGSLREIDIYRAGKLHSTVDLYEILLGKASSDEFLQDQDLVIVRPYFGRILFEGEIKRPGLYETKEGEVLSNLLELAGGFSDNAYRRNVTIRRNNDLRKSILSVDESKYGQFVLQGGDEILVSEVIPEFENRVQIEGAINKPGEYELLENLTLQDLINAAEGLRGDAFRDRAIILRKKPDFTLESVPINLNKIFSGELQVNLQNEDIVKIQSNFDLKEKYFISVQGEVNSPGSLAFVENMTVEDVIFLANGFKESAAKSFVEVSRRIDSEDLTDLSKSSLIFNFSISRDLKLDESASDFRLEPFDLVIIRRSPNEGEPRIVEVEGEVNYPGKYALEKRDERISDLLKRSGGMSEFGYIKGATLIRRTEYYVDSEEDSEAAKQRRLNLKSIAQNDTIEIKQQESIGIELEEILNNPGSKYDLILKPGDILSIPKRLQTVRLRGELLYPATVRFDKSMSFKGYISQAGGFNNTAKKSKSYVVYANGSSQRTKRFLWFNLYPNVDSGAEIIVPMKPEKRKLSAAEVVGLSTSIATFGLVVLRVIDFIDNQ